MELMIRVKVDADTWRSVLMLTEAASKQLAEQVVPLGGEVELLELADVSVEATT
jgi:hypothetical protein